MERVRNEKGDRGKAKEKKLVIKGKWKGERKGRKW